MPILFTHCTLSCLFFLASFKIIMSIFSSISKFYAIFNDLFQKEYVIFFDQFQIFGPKFWSILIFMPIFFSHFTCSSPFCALSIFVSFLFHFFFQSFLFGFFSFNFFHIFASNVLPMRLSVNLADQFARKSGWAGAEQAQPERNRGKCELTTSNCPYGLWLNASCARRLRI